RVGAGARPATRAVSGVVAPDAPAAEDVSLPSPAVRRAMHGDRLLVHVESGGRRGRHEGRIVKVLERGTTRVVGVLRRGRTATVLIPQEQRLTVPILVPRDADGGAAAGEMVV